ncbi:hypothetical protein D0O09_07180 [Pseudomonas putida]|nr:hypothetical protein D0O09_07180 [Pseudomonas putida]
MIIGRTESNFASPPQSLVGAGLPAKQTTRWMAPASPVIAGKPAPTGTVQASSPVQALWERACPRSSDSVDGTGFAGVRG